ncbi:hypothetical protein [Streptomyces ziwulingensis]|uniref:Uncharacterized protein n=1 Tax=Streptomyces ziwulingensis TaxID=1045501 RepID=A0ABP9CUF7_9ACTN
MSRRNGGFNPLRTLAARLGGASGQDGYGPVRLLGSDAEETADLAATADALRLAGPEQATVVVGAGVDGSRGRWKQLAPVLDGFRKTGVTSVRLVWAGAGADRPGRPAVARRVSQEWQVEVVAPAGPVVVAPGGSLFAPAAPDGTGGWWRFTPGLDRPRPLGLRHPVPNWEDAAAHLTADAVADHVVESVPAGVLIRRPGPLTEAARAVAASLPVDEHRLAVVVGAPGTPPVTGPALAALLNLLPSRARAAVRLVPGDGRDLLATGQETAELLGAEVEVVSGVPALLESADGTVAETAVVLIGADGEPSWRPYAEAVACLPAQDGRTPVPRVVQWRPPVAGLPAASENGALLLDDEWQVVVTRAGLWVGPRDDPRPGTAGWELDPETMVVDVGAPGRPLDDGLWPVLDAFLGELEPAGGERRTLHVLGTCGAQGRRHLRRVTERRGLALVYDGETGAVGEEAEPAGRDGAQTRAAGSAPGRTEPAGPSASQPDVPAEAPWHASPMSVRIRHVAAPPPAGADSPTLTSPSPSGGATSSGPARGGSAGSLGVTSGGATGSAGVPSGRGMGATGGPAGGSGAAPGGRAASSPSAWGDTPATSVPVSGGPGVTSSSGAGGFGVASGAGGSGAASVSGAGGSAAAFPSAPGGSGGSSTAGAGGADGLGPAAVGGAVVNASGGVGGSVTPPGSRVRSAVPPGFAEAFAATRPAGSPAGRPVSASWRTQRAAPTGGPTALSATGQAVTAGGGAPGAPAAPAVPVPVATPPPSAGLPPVAGPGHPPVPPAPATYGGGPPVSHAPVVGPGLPPVPPASVTGPGLPPVPPAPGSGHPSVPAAPGAGVGRPAGPPAPAPAAVHGGGSPLAPAAVAGPRGPAVSPVRGTAPGHPPVLPAQMTGPAGSAGSSAPVGGPRLPPVPGRVAAGEARAPGAAPVRVGPLHRSGVAERQALRGLAGEQWWQQQAAVTRTLTVMPGLRVPGQDEAVLADLIAVRSFLSLDDGPLSWSWLEWRLASGSDDAHPFLACLASGLRRLPSYRGVVVRDAGALPPGARTPAPGGELHAPGPVATYELEHAPPSGTHRYLIWSVTGRRVRSLYTAPGAGSAEEVVFAPGTRFRVLGTHGGPDATTVLLREVADAETAARAGEQDAQDRGTLAQLTQAADRSPAGGATAPWPPRLTGPPAIRFPDRGIGT